MVLALSWSPWSQAFSQQVGSWMYLAFAVTKYRSTAPYKRKHVFRCVVSLAGGHGGTEWLTSWCRREGIQEKARIRFSPRVTHPVICSRQMSHILFLFSSPSQTHPEVCQPCSGRHLLQSPCRAATGVKACPGTPFCCFFCCHSLCQGHTSAGVGGTTQGIP